MSQDQPDRPTTPDLATLLRAVTSAPTRRKQPNMPEMPVFPTGIFPKPVADWLGPAATATRIHPECVALPFLALTGALVGNRATLDVGLGWTEYPLLWIALVAPSGGGKTPALATATQPFQLLAPSLITNETAPAHLADSLATRPGVALMQDELIGLVRALNQSRRADDRQRMLSLWSSQPTSTSATARRNGTPSIIPAPVVAIVGGVQTRVAPGLRSRDQDGLAERFIPVVTNPVAVYWSESRNTRYPAPDLPAVIAWLTPLANLAKLANLQPDSSPGDGCLRILRSPEAATIWTTWYNGNVDRCHAAPAALSGYYLKLPSQVARLALILHLLWHPADPDRPLDAPTMHRAIELGEFIRIHLHRFVYLLGYTGALPSPPKPTLEQRLLRLLAETSDPEGWLSRTDLYNQAGRPSRKVLADALKDLLAKRAIESQVERQPDAGRPLTRYRLK